MNTQRKVIDLGVFRRKRNASAGRPTLFYATNFDAPDFLAGLRSWRTIRIADIEDLREAVSTRCPDIVLTDPQLSWLPVEDLVSWLDRSLAVPIVMIDRLPETKFDAMRLKRLYSLGLHDVLVPPFGEAELEETLGLLLKFSRSVQGYSS